MIYMVWEVLPFAGGHSLQKVFNNKEDADKYATEKNKEVEKDQKYDDFGLIESLEYIVQGVGTE